MRPGLLLILVLACAAMPAHAGGCRRAGVEWIVGGTAPVDCDAQVVAATAESRMKVSTTSQRQRDDERRQILAQELAQEEHLLPRAPDADSAVRTRANIAALKREMARLAPASR